jgi:hypothetical protein
MRIHDVTGESAVDQFIAKLRYEEYSTALPASRCGMLNLKCTRPCTIHIHDGNSKFEWI